MKNLFQNLFHEIENFLNHHWVVRINLIVLFFICLSPAVLFLNAWWSKTPVPGLTSFYGAERHEAVLHVILGVIGLVLSMVPRWFVGGVFSGFLFLTAAVYLLFPYLKYFYLTNDLHVLSYVLIGMGVLILTSDKWFSKAPNYPPVVSGSAILFRTILFYNSTTALVSTLVLLSLFGVYYSSVEVEATFSGTQMASILGGVTSAPILKNMPKVKDWLYDLISSDIKRNNQYTAIIGTGPLATSFIREDVRNEPPKTGVDKAFVLYAEQEELTPDLIELCQERFIGVCQPSQFESRWISEIDIANLERIFIGTGNDLTNIERLGVFMDEMKNYQNKKIKITIEIEDRDLIPFLDEAFSQWADTDEKTCGSQQNRNVTLQYTSYSELAAHDYFQTAEPKYLKKVTKGDKKGLTEYLNDLDAASIVLIGTGKLAREFIYFLAKIWHLPTLTDENASPKIILMGNDQEDGQPISNFYREICQTLPGISDYFVIKKYRLDFFKDKIDSQDNYDNVWGDEKLKRIFLLDDDTYKNIELINVFINKAYRDDMVLKCPNKTRREIFIANKSYKKLREAMSINPVKQLASKLHYVNSIGLLGELSKDDLIFNDEVAEITQQIKGILTVEESNKGKKDILTDEDSKEGENDDADEMHNDLTRQRSAKSLAQHLPVKLLMLGLESRRTSDEEWKNLCDDKRILSKKDKKALLLEVNKGSFYDALVSYCEAPERWGGCGNYTTVVEHLNCLLKLKDCEPMSKDDKPMSPEELIVEIYDQCDQREEYGNPIASLINCEHDRWCCYHQINNWRLPEKDNEETADNCLTKESAPEKINQKTADNYLTKESPLLMRLDSLEGDLRNKAIVRAFKQYLCIPEILANAGCLIHSLEGGDEQLKRLLEDGDKHLKSHLAEIY